MRILKTLIRISALLASLFVLMPKTHAQWVKQSGVGGTTSSFYSDGTTLYQCAYTGLLSTTNNGTDWVALNNLMPEQFCNSMAKNSTYIFTSMKGVIWRTSDNGKKWTENTSPLPFAKNIITYGNSILTATVGGMYRSENNGTSWVLSNSGIPADTVEGLFLYGQKIFAGTHRHGAFVSNDAGLSWQPTSSGSDSHYFHSFANDDSKLYAVGDFTQEHGGVFYSADEGKTWTDISSSNIQIKNATCIVAFSNNLFISTLNFGVFASNDNGKNWKEINEGIGTWEMFDWAIIKHDKYLFLGTESGFIERRPLSEVLTTSSIAEQELTQPSVLVSPNPASDILAVTLPQNSDYSSIQLYDILGNNILSRPCSNSQSVIEVDVHNVSQGMYSIRLSNEFGKVFQHNSVCVIH